MSDLVCIAFKDRDTADNFLNELRSMQKEHILELEDAVIAVRDEDGKMHLKQSVNLVAPGAAGGGSWGAMMGTLIGLIFLNPPAGLVVGGAAGAAAGALRGSLSDYGIDDNFIKSLGESIEPDSSAVFLLVRKAVEDKVMPRVAQFEGKVIRTSLSDADEARLQEALSKAA